MLRSSIFIILWTILLPCYAWNALGHEIVAAIAYQNLKPNVKKKVNEMATVLSQEYPSITSFVQMAPWPDSLRSQKIEIYTHWHYIDHYFSTDGTPITTAPDTDNVVFALNQMEPILSNTHANPYDQARILAFFVHCVGDIHQPLHTTSRVSATYPKGDLGGNLYYVYYPTQNTTTSLHTLWDNGFNFLSGEVTDENASSIAHTITALYPESYFGNKANDLYPEDWANEGTNLAIKITYQTPEYEVPSTDYQGLGTQTVEQQLALAGYRLAHLLNTLYSD